MHPKLIRYATTLMGDADEAKDIVSEVFGKAWQDFDSLGERIYFRMKREHSIEEVLEVLNDLGIAQFCMKGNRIVVAKK